MKDQCKKPEDGKKPSTGKASEPAAADTKPAPVPPLGPAGEPKAAIPSGIWGCSRCRWRQTGCLSCNPEKMLRYLEKLKEGWGEWEDSDDELEPAE